MNLPPIPCPKCHKEAILKSCPGLEKVNSNANGQAMQVLLCSKCWGEMNFQVQSLKGGLGQMILRSILEYSGYQVYPYGYEHTFYSVMKPFRHEFTDDTIQQLRITPDLLVVDEDIPAAHLVEVKATRQDIGHFYIEEDKLLGYQQHWPTSMLAILHIPSMRFYCVPVKDIQVDTMEPRPWNGRSGPLGYYLDLSLPYVKELEEMFSRVDHNILNAYMEWVKVDMVGKYSGQPAPEVVRSLWQ